MDMVTVAELRPIALDRLEENQAIRELFGGLKTTRYDD